MRLRLARPTCLSRERRPGSSGEQIIDRFRAPSTNFFKRPRQSRRTPRAHRANARSRARTGNNLRARLRIHAHGKEFARTGGKLTRTGTPRLRTAVPIHTHRLRIRPHRLQGHVRLSKFPRTGTSMHAHQHKEHARGRKKRARARFSATFSRFHTCR